MSTSTWLQDLMNANQGTRSGFRYGPQPAAPAAPAASASSAQTPLPANWRTMTPEQKKEWVLANRMSGTSAGSKGTAASLMSFFK